MTLRLTSYRAAIIDLDGTLVDTLGDFAAALAHMLHALGLPPLARSFIAQTVGKGSEHLIRRSLEQVGGDAGLYDRAWTLYQAHYETINGRHAEVYPGVPEGLQRLGAAGIALACVTNKPTAFAGQLLRDKGLRGYFQGVYGGDAFERKKPDPMPLLRTCELLGCTPTQTLMVGDSSNDAQAARAAGCRVVLVTYGYNHGEPIRAVDADGFVDRLDALPLPP